MKWDVTLDRSRTKYTKWMQQISKFIPTTLCINCGRCWAILQIQVKQVNKLSEDICAEEIWSSNELKFNVASLSILRYEINRWSRPISFKHILSPRPFSLSWIDPVKYSSNKAKKYFKIRKYSEITGKISSPPSVESALRLQLPKI